MGSIRLAKEELHQLPPVCYVCGEYADTTQSSDPRESAALAFFGLSFPWMLTGLSLALFVDVMVLRLRPDQIRLPTCELHRNHWRLRTWLATLLAFSSWVDLIVALVALENLSAWTGRFFVVGAILWTVTATILAVWLDQTGPRIESCWQESVILMDVHEEFVAAIEELRDDPTQ